MEVWVPQEQLYRELGLTPRMLDLGKKSGFLQEITHYRKGCPGTIWALNRIRMIAGEIRMLGIDQGVKGCASRFVPANTSKKRELLEAMNLRHAQLLAMEFEADRICHEIQSLEYEYCHLLWERPSCPYCSGTGILGKIACQFCVEVLT